MEKQNLDFLCLIKQYAAKQPPAKGYWKISRHEKKFKNSLILKIFPYDQQ